MSAEENNFAESLHHTDGVPAVEAVTNLSNETSEQKPVEKEIPARLQSNELDLVFVMDCTGSMGSYIESARSNIQRISEEIISKEKADVRLALVKYRDHPPQDTSFITDVHDFTSSVREMKSWLHDCSASGGGDGPEAVADGLHATLKLSWREKAVKFCILIADAPPHGLDKTGDGFPDGCPFGLDPVQIVNTMAEKEIVLYVAGCEPSLRNYRDFFAGLAHVTGGQYVPLTHATVLAKVIIGGAQEELSLQALVQELDRELAAEVQRAEESGSTIDKEALSSKIMFKAKLSGAKVKQFRSIVDNAAPIRTERAENIASKKTMKEASEYYNETLDDSVSHNINMLPMPFARSAVAALDMPIREDASGYEVLEEQEVSAEQINRLVSRGINKHSKK